MVFWGRLLPGIPLVWVVQLFQVLAGDPYIVEYRVDPCFQLLRVLQVRQVSQKASARPAGPSGLPTPAGPVKPRGPANPTALWQLAGPVDPSGPGSGAGC